MNSAIIRQCSYYILKIKCNGIRLGLLGAYNWYFPVHRCKKFGSKASHIFTLKYGGAPYC